MKKMNQVIKHSRLLFPLFLFLVCTGCYEVPYLFKAKDQAIVIPELHGKWTRVNLTAANRGGHATIIVEDDSPTLSFDYNDGRPWNMNVLLHRIGNKTIASAQKKDGTQSSYAIFLVEFDTHSPDKLVLKTMNENAPFFKEKEAFVEFLLSDKSDQHFVRPLVFERVG